MQQSFIFDRPRALARRTDPQSSHVAAQKMVETGAILSHEAIILDVVKRYPGRNAKQLAQLCDLTDVEITRRGAGMVKKGLVKREPPPGGGEIQWWAI